MDSQPNFEYLCRICAANTRGKNSVAECVYILKTPLLKEKIEKHLYLQIEETDVLPKVLCKTCFRQVEATASLSKIAKHTEKVFRDFISFSAAASKPPQTDAINYSTDEDITITTVNEYTPLALVSKETTPDKQPPQAHVVIRSPPPPPPNISNLPSGGPPINRGFNATINDAQTHKQTKPQKTNNASSPLKNSQQSAHPTSNIPKSIAQKGNTPKIPSPSNATKKISTSPAGVINFMHSRAPHHQVTAITSGGHVIGRVNTNAMPPPPNTQQKRRNFKTTAMNNVNKGQATSGGQVSLLKKSVSHIPKTSDTEAEAEQTRSILAPKKIQTTPNHQSVANSSTKQMATLAAERDENQTSAILNDDVEDLEAELPNQIIIAAAKKKKQAEKPSTPPVEKTVTVEKVKAVRRQKAGYDKSKIIAAVNSVPVEHSKVEPLVAAPFTAPVVSKPGLPEDIVLGKVIKDVDLLKLILKALKWPVTQQTLEQQMDRLRNSQFATIMSDSNLLQDTDLTQILGPYLAPVLLAAQAMQQQKIVAAAVMLNQQPVAEIQVPYKLPAETSVQLVPASPPVDPVDPAADPKPPATASASNHSLKKRSDTSIKSRAVKKQRRLGSKSQARRNQSGHAFSIIISDEEDSEENTNLNMRQNSKSTPNVSSSFKVDIDPSFLTQMQVMENTNSDANNEALLALLQRQKAALTRMERTQRERRNSDIITVPINGSDDLDDIVLVEGQGQSFETSLETTSSVSSAAISSNDTSTSTLNSTGFAVPENISMPLITRPIIKRRKTVITSSPARTCLKVKQSSEESVNDLEDTLKNTVATQKPSLENNTVATQIPSLTETCQKPTKSNKKSPKSILGQQLLEAIGIQEALSSISVEPCVSTKESVQQIRTALKRSLKEAQEQQLRQRKSSSPVVQDADSTTKNLVKEVLVSGQSKDNSNSQSLDVEDEIDKIALVIENKPKTSTEINKHKITKKYFSASPNKRKTLGNRRRKSNSAYVIEKVKPGLKTIVEESETKLTDVPKTESEAVLTNVITSTDENAKQAEVSPKRRGRKRLEDKSSEPVIAKRVIIADESSTTPEPRTPRSTSHPSRRSVYVEYDDEDSDDAGVGVKIDLDFGSSSGRATRACKNQPRKTQQERSKRLSSVRVTRKKNY